MDTSAITGLLPVIGNLALRVIAAALVLLIGWLLAKWIAKLVYKLLEKVQLDKRIAGSAEDERVPKVEETISSIVYYVLMLLVLIGVFEVLGLTLITEPLNAILNAIFGYLPNLLSAGILIAAAWIIAVILRGITYRILQGMHVDKRLGQDEDTKKVSVAKALSEAVYWLVWLVFLLPILQALGFDSLVTPLTQMFTDILGYLPNILAAAVILIVGWFVARIVQRVVTSFLVAIGTDRFSDRIGLGKMLGKQNLSGLLGFIVFLLILLPIFMASLEALGIQSLTEPLTAMLNTVLVAIPAIIAAAIILFLAYIGGKLLGELVANLLEGLGFDNIMVTLGLSKETASWKVTPSQIVGYLVLFAVMLLATIGAVSLLNMPALTLIVAQFTAFVWHIFIGLIIFGLGLWLASLVANMVANTDWPNRNLLGIAARVAIIALSLAMALKQMGLADSIINMAFGLTLGAAALAVALAFGLGGREVASRELEGWVETMHTQPQVPAVAEVTTTTEETAAEADTTEEAAPDEPASSEGEDSE